MSVGTMNKVFPQADAESNITTRRKARPGDEGCGPLCCSRRGACLSVGLLLLLAMLAALLAVATILGHPPRTPGDVPQSLPSFLLTTCGDPDSWIYSDQKCDGVNNCGDCSDELSPVTTCPPCGPGWWRCSPTVFKYCSCVPRDLCRDSVQHCSDWSDEYSCPGP
ncbi:low-density lipoprotein receptor class A domain-containing protein 1 isoform X3 [Mus musculus]|uniref:low-density lipoprotein receptor class A domain-containing protein 1 isoform X3 n=1 Tax=Mus musculus TaxID=10090 RepID=UPI0003D7077C|nr:low-density lipoprotein receptor class A domain-containing protein 1 isoform X3 [Mus musculus]|eukprot:XP_006503306.1 PREDICTED: low-density lipoprotein receptor class A domain-containing protein 1 isoform X3 [Mus musculus]